MFLSSCRCPKKDIWLLLLLHAHILYIVYYIQGIPQLYMDYDHISRDRPTGGLLSSLDHPRGFEMGDPHQVTMAFNTKMI